MRKVYVDDEAVKSTIEAVVTKAAEVEALGLELGKVVVPTISLNSPISALKFHNIGAMGINDVYVIPKGRVVVAIWINAGTVGNFKLQFDRDGLGTWDVVVYAVTLTGNWEFMPILFGSPEDRFRFIALTTAVLDANIVYMGEDI